MIVVKPTWTRRLKKYRTVWWHEWHDAPMLPDGHIQTGSVLYREYERHPYSACVSTYGVRTPIGEFDTLEAAQAACDVLCAERLGTTLAEATANWKTWVREQKTARTMFLSK